MGERFLMLLLMVYSLFDRVVVVERSISSFCQIISLGYSTEYSRPFQVKVSSWLYE